MNDFLKLALIVVVVCVNYFIAYRDGRRVTLWRHRDALGFASPVLRELSRDDIDSVTVFLTKTGSSEYVARMTSTTSDAQNRED